MKLIIQDQELTFLPVPITFQHLHIKDIFARKNNKTLGETIRNKPYSSLAVDVQNLYAPFMNEPLGRFLWQLKNSR